MLTHHSAAPALPKRTVVIGSGGFVGGELVRRLHKVGGAVHGVARKDVDLLAPDASAVFNADSEWAPYMKRICKAERAVTVGLGVDAEVRIVDVDLHLQGATFTLLRQRSDLPILPERVVLTTKLLGGFNVMNAALCAVLCMLDGMPADREIGRAHV